MRVYIYVACCEAKNLKCLLYVYRLHCKKKVSDFASPAGMSLTKLTLAARESLVGGIPAGDGKIVNLFLQCTIPILVR
jgi:hypothetical protein